MSEMVAGRFTWQNLGLMTARLLVLTALLLPALGWAEDPKAKAAREELEKQLTQMMGKVPTRVRVDFVGLDDPNYRLEESSFELDGRSLRSPPSSQLMDEGKHLVWEGDATPGKHVVRVRLVFSNGASVLLSDEGGYKWKVGGEVSFDLQAGIEVRVAVTPKRDSTQQDVAKRFRLSLPAEPVMLAKLDDGKMPDAPPKPNFAVAEEPVDAGVAVAAVDQKKLAAEAAAEAKRLAAEEKKAKAEAAAEAKRLAAEEKKAKAAAALEAKRLAAEEKKAKAAAALEAKKAAAEEKKRKAAEAAEEKKRQAEELANAKRLSAEEKKQALDAALAKSNDKPTEAPPAEDAPPTVVEEPVVDAGAEVAAAPVVVVDAGVAPGPVATAPASDEGGIPWIPVLAVAGVAIVLMIIVARRKAQPPKLDD